MSDERHDANVIELRPRARAPHQEDLPVDPTPKLPDGLLQQVEALLFVSSTPMKTSALAAAVDEDEQVVEHALLELMQQFAEPARGIVLERVADGWAFRAADAARDALARMYSPTADTKLSPAAAETLAIVAYLQPVSRPEIARIRGVSVDAAVSNLLDRGFVEEAGRSETGAVRFRTTAAFERAFGLPSLAALPALEGFGPGEDETARLREQLEKMAAARVD